MVKRRVSKRKRRRVIPRTLIQRETRFGNVASPSSNNIDVTQNHRHSSYDHPYATRSKTLRTAKSSINMDENDYAKLTRRRSDSSIVFLGTYRKVPQLVVLQESSEGRCVEFVEKPEALICLKAEKMDCQSCED